MLYKISIIIPVFNVEEYLPDAFESILNQTIGFDNLEVIFVDDASTDNCSTIIDEYSKRYSNVISLHLKMNSGAAGKPRNIGMKHATADYLMFLDPDDLFVGNACEILYEEITSENLDMVSGIHTLDGKDIQRSLWRNILTDPYDTGKIRTQQVNDMVKNSNFCLKLDSIDDYPSVISNFGMWTKIYKKSFLQKNNIKFPEGIPAQDSVFLFNVLLNAKGIKFVNKVIVDHLTRNSSISYEFTKQRVKERLDAYYEMFYISTRKNKSEIFKYYILFNKLNYFLDKHLMICDLPTKDILEILEYAYPLFKFYFDYNNKVKGKFSKLFKFIANKDYENALKIIFDENAPNQNEIKVIGDLDSYWDNLIRPQCNFIDFSGGDWLSQFEKNKPNLFFCSASNNFNNEIINEILSYCKKSNILSILLNNKESKNRFQETFLNFDYIFNSFEDYKSFYFNKGYQNVFNINENIINLNKNDLDLINNDGFFNDLKNQSIFIQILNQIDFKYIPNLKHIVLYYELNELNELNNIYSHFDSISYHYKHIKLITDDNLFLSDSISRLELNDAMKEDYYFTFIKI